MLLIAADAVAADDDFWQCVADNDIAVDEERSVSGDDGNVGVGNVGEDHETTTMMASTTTQIQQRRIIRYGMLSEYKNYIDFN